MTSYKKKPCKALKLDGSQCQTAALPKSIYCFFHDPSKAAERRKAQASGGRANRLKTLDAATPETKIQDCRGALALIWETINPVRTGQIDARVANSIGYLANIAIKASERTSIPRSAIPLCCRAGLAEFGFRRQLFSHIAALVSTASAGSQSIEAPAPFLWVVDPAICGTAALKQLLRLLCRHAFVVNLLSTSWMRCNFNATQPYRRSSMANACEA